MKIYLWAHLIGAISAVVLQLILITIIRSKMAPIRSYIKAMNNELNTHGLYLDTEKKHLKSLTSGVICPIFSVIQPLPYLTASLIVQSLILSWFNFLLIGIGVFTQIAGPSKLGEGLDEEIESMKDPELLAIQLKQLSTSAMPPNANVMKYAQIESFIDEHINAPPPRTAV
jgi:hypothetical protein